jgi:hypothetical protein
MFDAAQNDASVLVRADPPAGPAPGPAFDPAPGPVGGPAADLAVALAVDPESLTAGAAACIDAGGGETDARNGEDAIVESLLAARFGLAGRGLDTLFYVEIGVTRPLRASSTDLLSRRHGATGVLVAANADLIDELRSGCRSPPAPVRLRYPSTTCSPASPTSRSISCRSPCKARSRRCWRRSTSPPTARWSSSAG